MRSKIVAVLVAFAMVATSGLAFAGSQEDMWDETDVIGFTQHTDAEAEDVKGEIVPWVAIMAGASLIAIGYVLYKDATNQDLNVHESTLLYHIR